MECCHKDGRGRSIIKRDGESSRMIALFPLLLLCIICDSIYYLTPPSLLLRLCYPSFLSISRFRLFPPSLPYICQLHSLLLIAYFFFPLHHFHLPLLPLPLSIFPLIPSPLAAPFLLHHLHHQKISITIITSERSGS